MEKRKITSVEKSVRRTLFYRRLRGGVVVLAVLLVCVIAYVFRAGQRYQGQYVDIPNYAHLDKSSPTYWADRVDTDIEAIRRSGLSPQQEDIRLRDRLRRTLSDAAATPQGFGRSVAVTETALAVLRHDVNIGIEGGLEAMGETPLAVALRAKVLVANALMLLRLGDRVAAAIAMKAYDRTVNQADLKLDTEASELAFRGAVRVYRHTFDSKALDALIQRNLKYTPQIPDLSLRMKAYRIVATEQAFAGQDRDALDTAAKINNPVELVRAFQGIIINVARPGTPELSEPDFFRLNIEGPWSPLPQQGNAKRIINEVLRQIASHGTVGDQVDLLMRLAGSGMMCDPELNVLFKSCLIESGEIDKIAKRPVLQRLQAPESPSIRKALGMPPSAETRSRDSALDDWTRTSEDVSVDTAPVDPIIVKSIITLERLRIQLSISRSYLAVSRRMDAARSLQQAFETAQTLPNIGERIDFLLDIVGMQISAGDFGGSRNTFLAIGLPRRDDGVPIRQNGSSDLSAETEFDGNALQIRLARLARLKILARSLEDAERTINLLPPSEEKDEECAFLATELIRIQRLREAARVIDDMSQGPQQAGLLQRLEIAKGGTEENYRNLNIAFPEKTTQDDALVDLAVSLTRLGLHDTARETVKRISRPEIRAAQSHRIIRDLLLFYGAYGSEESEHQAARRVLLDIVLRAANDIEPALERAVALETILSVAIPFAKGKEERELLQAVVFQSLELARRIPMTTSGKMGTLARLLSARILLHALLNDRPLSWPLLDKEHDKALIDEITEALVEVIDVLNDADDDAGRGRGMLAAARVFGQIGRTNTARQLLGGVLEIAKQQNDKRVGVSLFRGTVPLFRALDGPEAAKSVYYDAFAIVSNVPDDDPTGGNAGMIFGVRLRDSEIDLLVRSLLENDFIPDAIHFANRITEDVMRNRLMEIAAFRTIDKEEFAEAENIARKLPDLEKQSFLLRCVAFAKRQKSERENE